MGTLVAAVLLLASLSAHADPTSPAPALAPPRPIVITLPSACTLEERVPLELVSIIYCGGDPVNAIDPMGTETVNDYYELWKQRVFTWWNTPIGAGAGVVITGVENNVNGNFVNNISPLVPAARRLWTAREDYADAVTDKYGTRGIKQAGVVVDSAQAALTFYGVARPLIGRGAPTPARPSVAEPVEPTVPSSEPAPAASPSPALEPIPSSEVSPTKPLDVAPPRSVSESAHSTYAQIKAEETAARAYGGINPKPTSPNAAARSMVQGEYIDPLTNKVVKTTGPLAADHIVAQKVIKGLPGFNELTYSQQSAVLNYIEDFQGLPKSFNSSKGSLLPSEWESYKGNPLDPAYIARGAAIEKVLLAKIQEMIDNLNRSNGVSRK